MEVANTEPDKYDADSIEGDIREGESAQHDHHSDADVDVDSIQEEEALLPEKRNEGRPPITGKYVDYRLVHDREERARQKKAKELEEKIA